jgi:hypothetical protein
METIIRDTVCKAVCIVCMIATAMGTSCKVAYIAWQLQLDIQVLRWSVHILREPQLPATLMHVRYTVAMDTCCKVGYMACVLMLPAKGAKLG